MFEKEAEERITGQFGTSGEYATRQRIWQKGAEFGYNKAKEEMQEQIEKMKCCFNCRHSRTECEHCKTDKHEKWEIKND